MTTITPTASAPGVKDQATVLAGYVGHRTIVIGVQAGLFAALADQPDGSTPTGAGRPHRPRRV